MDVTVDGPLGILHRRGLGAGLNGGSCGELSLEFSEADHLAIHFIPQPKFDRFETVEKAQFWRLLEEGVRVMATFQIVVGNEGVQVMDVVESDVA